MIYTVLQPFNLNLDKVDDLKLFNSIIDLNSIKQKLNARISIILGVELNSNLTLDLTSDLINKLNNLNEELRIELNQNMKEILKLNLLNLKKILTDLKITVEFLYSYEYKNIDYDRFNLEELRQIIFNNDTNTDKNYTQFYHENLNVKLDKFFTDFNKFKDELNINNKLTEFKNQLKKQVKEQVEEQVEEEKRGGNNKKSKYILYLNKFDLNKLRNIANNKDIKITINLSKKQIINKLVKYKYP
jgi:hypothetical protein